MFQLFSQQFSELLDGRLYDETSTALQGGALIRNILSEQFVATLDEINIEETISEEDIKIAIQNSTGLSYSLLIPDTAFEKLVKKCICTLEEPSLDCVGQVFDELSKFLGKVRVKDMNRFDSLKYRVKAVVRSFLESNLEKTNKKVKY
jgi:dynamin 1-like protein